MDWFPLWNSLRIAAISTVLIFFLGIAAAYYIAKLPRLVKGVLDVVLTLPLVLPPTVVGYLLLRLLGPRRIIGAWVLETFGVRLVMVWWSAIFATVVVAFPLMYRTARGAFESFDETLSHVRPDSGPLQRLDLLAGADALLPPGHPGGHGAGLRPGPGRVRRHLHDCRATPPARPPPSPPPSTSSGSTGDDAMAFRWVLVNVAISAVFLLAVNLLESTAAAAGREAGR